MIFLLFFFLAPLLWSKRLEGLGNSGTQRAGELLPRDSTWPGKDSFPQQARSRRRNSRRRIRAYIIAVISNLRVISIASSRYTSVSSVITSMRFNDTLESQGNKKIKPSGSDYFQFVSTCVIRERIWLTNDSRRTLSDIFISSTC